ESPRSSDQHAISPLPTDERSMGPLPAAAGEARIGVDEWAAQVGARRHPPVGRWQRLLAGLTTIPASWRYGLALLLLVLMPPLTGMDLFLEAAGISNNSFILTIGTRFLVFALLAIGLNVIVGYAGLLDLGYVAFYGIAGYLYAYLSSEFVR